MLVEIKPEIYKKIKTQKLTAANTAAIRELQQKSSKKGISKQGGGGNSNSGDSKDYRDCKTCDKQHPGVCWDLEKRNRNPKKRGS